VKKCTVLVLLAIAAFPLLGQTPSSQTPDEGQLKGLNQVVVLIESIDPQAVAAGLTAAKVRTDVELRLRRAGIKIPRSADEMAKDQGYLDVILNLMRNPDMPVWAIVVEVQLSQAAQLERPNAPIPYVLATTWKTGDFGFVGSNLLTSRVRESVDDCVDKFINAYLAANQK
jgi:hypothetical protein